MTEKTKCEPFGFEDAITKCGLGKFNYIVMGLAGSLMACAFIELSSVNLVLSIAQCDLPMTSRDKGILGAIGYVGVILSSHLWGFLADTKGRRKTLIPTLLVAFTVTMISSLVNNFWALVFFRFVNGFFISCASATTFAFLGEFHDAQNRGRILMRTSVIYAVMSMLMPTFGILTLNQEWSFNLEFLGITYKPWRFFLLLCGLPSLLCAAVLYFIVPESPKFAFSQGDEEGTLKILQKMYCMNTGADASTYDVKSLAKNEESYGSDQKDVNFFRFMWMQSVPFFSGMHLRNILTASFINFSICLTTNGFFTFLPEILDKVSLWIERSDQPATVCEIFYAEDLVKSVTEHSFESACHQKLEVSTFVHVYEILLLFGVCWTIMSLLINRIGKLLILLAVLITCGIASILLGLLRMPIILPYVYVYMISSGCGMSVVNASTAELFPTKMRAMAICVSMMVGRVGSSVGSIVIGFFIDKYCSWTFAMPVVLLFSSAVLACTIPNISKRQK